MPNDLTLTPRAPAVTDFSVAPPARQSGTVAGFTGPAPGTGPLSIPWGSINGNMLAQIDLQQQFATKAGLAQFTAHVNDFNNPHHVDKADVGLPLVDNIAPLDMPVSVPQQIAIAAVVTGPIPAATIVATQIIDSNASGRAILTGANANGATIGQSATTLGKDVAIAATAAAARTVLGATTLGNTLFTAADVQTAQTALVMSAQPTFRNLVINGKADANQYANTVTAGGGYICDMWSAFNGGGTVTGSLVSSGGLSEFQNCLRLTSGAANAAVAGSYWPISNSIEGVNISCLNWGTVNGRSASLSFWVRCSVAGTYGATLRNTGSTRCYAINFVLAANTWTKIERLIPPCPNGTWDVGNGVGVNINICAGVGSRFAAPGVNAWLAGNFLGVTTQTNAMATNGATFDVTGLQFEPGVVVTPFEHRPWSVDVLMAQRYYYLAQKMFGLVTGSGAGTQIARMGCHLPTPMRIGNQPLAIVGSINLYDGAATGVLGSISVNYSTPSVVEFDGNSSAGVFLTPRSVITYNPVAGVGIVLDARM